MAARTAPAAHSEDEDRALALEGVFDDSALAFNFGQQDITTPVIRLLQPSRMDQRFNEVDDGHFVNVATGEDLGTQMEVVVLGAQKTRARFGKEGEGLLCRSVDTIAGTGNPGGSCATCPFAQWHGRDQAPECALAWSYFVLPVVAGKMEITEFTLPAIFRLSRSGFSEAKRWNSQLGSWKPPFAVVYEISTVETRAAKGAKYFAPRVRPVRRISDHDTLAKLYDLSVRIAATRTEILAQSDASYAPDDGESGAEESGDRF